MYSRRWQGHCVLFLSCSLQGLRYDLHRCNCLIGFCLTCRCRRHYLKRSFSFSSFAFVLLNRFASRFRFFSRWFIDTLGVWPILTGSVDSAILAKTGWVLDASKDTTLVRFRAGLLYIVGLTACRLKSMFLVGDERDMNLRVEDDLSEESASVTCLRILENRAWSAVFAVEITTRPAPASVNDGRGTGYHCAINYG